MSFADYFTMLKSQERRSRVGACTGGEILCSVAHGAPF